jgi:hypothetical protein
MSAINHGMGVPTDSRRDVLMGYQYALHQQKKKTLQEKSELRRSHESNGTSSRLQWEESSETSKSSEERYHEPKHYRRRTGWSGKESRNSFVATDEEENIMQDTLEVTVVAAQAYLLTTKPKPGDPRESMHQAAIKSLGLIGDE